MLFLSVQADDVKLAGKKRNIDPMWNVLKKDFDVGRANITLGPRIWVAVNGNSTPAKILRTITEICMFASRTCAGAKGKLFFGETWRRHLLLVF